MRYTAVGKRIPRLDAPAHVTGQTQFAADLTLPGMLWGILLRSLHPHARIRSISTDKASRMLGVVAIVAGRDFPALAAKRCGTRARQSRRSRR